MSIEVYKATVPCGVCGAHVTELRRGRCWGCYTQWMEMRPVGKGATCVVCYERRREQLRTVELHSRSVPLCHGCAARIVKVVPLPDTVEGIRASLRRDRRDDLRRGEGIDQRIFPRERRVGDRRRPPREHGFADTDPAIVLEAFNDLVIEITEADIEVIEQTTVRETPLRQQ